MIAAPQPTTPCLYNEHDVICMEYPFGQSGSAFLAVPPPLPASYAHGRAQEAGKVLDSCKHYLATTKTSVCYQHYSHTKTKTHYTSYGEENELYPSQNQQKL